MKTFLFSYQYEGEWWDVAIRATSQEEAMARLKVIPWGSLQCELVDGSELTWFEHIKMWLFGGFQRKS